jgi:DNA primase
VNGFTDDHKAAFAKHGVKHVWIAYDRDEAGDAAAEQLKKELAHLEQPISTARVLFPKGMDANEYALKVTPASQSFAVLLNRTEKPPAVPTEPTAQVSGATAFAAFKRT